MRPEDLAIPRALYRPTTRGVRHREVADDFVMRLTVLKSTNPVKVQKPLLFRKDMQPRKKTRIHWLSAW